jgi:hypothetical protein
MSLSCRARLAPIFQKTQGAKTMQRIILTAAAVLLGAGLAVTAAKADMNYGPVVDQAKGLCFQKAPTSDIGYFGYWAECPKAAAAAAASTTTVHPRHTKHSEKGAQQAQ